MRLRPSRHRSLPERCLLPFPAAKRAHSKRSVGFSRARSGARGRLFLGVSPYGLLLNCWSARLAYFGWHVVPCPHSTPLPRLPGADEVRQGDPAAGSPAGAFRFPLCPLQSGGNHYAGSVCLDRPGGCSLPGVRGRLGEGKSAETSALRSPLKSSAAPCCRSSKRCRSIAPADPAPRRALIKLYRYFRWNSRQLVVISAYIL
jgi:hypothetical protein